MREPHPLPALDVEKALGWVETKMAVTLADEQREAIRQAVTQKLRRSSSPWRGPASARRRWSAA